MKYKETGIKKILSFVRIAALLMLSMNNLNCTIDGRLFHSLMQLIISSFLVGNRRSYSTMFCGLFQPQPLFLTHCTAHILDHRFRLCGNQLDSLHTPQCCCSLFFQSDKLNE